MMLFEFDYCGFVRSFEYQQGRIMVYDFYPSIYKTLLVAICDPITLTIEFTSDLEKQEFQVNHLMCNRQRQEGII